MRQPRVPAAFVRGGTSNAVVFDRRHLPDDEAVRERLFVAALGSPDPYGRQLDGMGGGISSLSKVCIVGPPSRPDADVDYTFGQVAVDRPQIDWSSNCGNMSSAIGPFAVDEGMVDAPGPESVVVIHNTNTGKLIRSRFPVEDGRAAVEGDTAIPGVPGTGAPVDLEFLDPGGAVTGALLPTGNVLDLLEVEGGGSVPVSMVDAANPFVFVDANDVGLTGTEMPAALDARAEVMERLERIRAAAAVAMGIAASPGRGVVPVPERAQDWHRGPAPARDDTPRGVREGRRGRPHRAHGVDEQRAPRPPADRGARICGRSGDRGHRSRQGGSAGRYRRRWPHPAHQSLRGDHGCRLGAPHRRRRWRLACRSCVRAPDPAPAVRRIRLRAGRPGAGARRTSRVYRNER